MAVSHSVDTIGPLDAIRERIRAVAEHPLRKDDPMLRIIGIKTFLDGGMLTGSAYMREPWGVSKIYSITDPDYRGVLFIPPERLLPIVRRRGRGGLQFTAHSVGDGAVHTLLDAYEEIDSELPPVARGDPAVHHPLQLHEPRGGRAAVASSASSPTSSRPGSTSTPARSPAQFGNDRLRYFQPLQDLFDAGVDRRRRLGPHAEDRLAAARSTRTTRSSACATAVTRTAHGGTTARSTPRRR